MERLSSIEELRRLQKKLLEAKDPQRLRVRVCMTGCRAFGAVEVRDAFEKVIDEKGLTGKVDIVETGCHGFCARAPVVAIDPHGFFYQQISPKDVPQIVQASLIEGKPVEKLLYKDPQTGHPVALEKDVPFYREQMKIVLRNCGQD
jgi:(2Fe-2S) ferredoxin